MTAPGPIYAATIPAAAHGGSFPADPPPFEVIHSTEGPMSDGNARALAVNWFGRSKADGGAGTSATDIFDPVEGIRMLDDHTVPYHVGPNGNARGTGSEHCGSVNLTTAQWMSDRGQAMLDLSARRQAQRARERGWSLDRCRWLTVTQVANLEPGFCTHNDIRLALGGTTHSDPGPNFPYDWYMSRIRYWYQNPNGTPEEDFLSELSPAEQRNLYNWVGQIGQRLPQPITTYIPADFPNVVSTLLKRSLYSQSLVEQLARVFEVDLTYTGAQGVNGRTDPPNSGYTLDATEADAVVHLAEEDAAKMVEAIKAAVTPPAPPTA